MDDITLLRRAVDETTRLIDGVRPEQLGAPTPCEAFTVQQLIDHLVEGTDMFGIALDGEPASSELSWKAVGARVIAAFEQPGGLDGAVTLSYGEYPREIVLQHALGETAIHAADLARATGQTLSDDFTEVGERVFTVVTDDWRADGVLGPPVACGDDAPLIDRVLAFAGRKS